MFHVGVLVNVRKIITVELAAQSQLQLSFTYASILQINHARMCCWVIFCILGNGSLYMYPGGQLEKDGIQNPFRQHCVAHYVVVDTTPLDPVYDQVC